MVAFFALIIFGPSPSNVKIGEVRTAIISMADALNHGRIDEYVNRFAENSTFAASDGRVFQGRDSIRVQLQSQGLNIVGPPFQPVTVEDIKLVAGSVAVVRAKWMTGLDSNGVELTTTMVWTKNGDRWKIDSVQGSRRSFPGRGFDFRGSGRFGGS